MRTLSKACTAALATSVLLASAGCNGGERPPCSLDGEIGTVCGFRNPEDLELVEQAGVVLVSNMRFDGPVVDGGYIAAVVPGQWTPRIVWGTAEATASAPEPALGDASCTQPPDPLALYPHGLTSKRRDGRTLVYMAAHKGEEGGREAVEIFELEGEADTVRLTWKACVPTEDEIQANDLVVADDETIVVSNYVPDWSIRHTLRAAILGQNTGDVMVWRPQSGWSHLAGTESRMANGVALSRNGQTLFYSETLGGKLHRRPLDSESGAIDVDIPGAPDNLTWTRRGTLLLATHTSGLRFLLCSFGRAPCRSSWEVYEIDPDTLAVTRLLSHSGEKIGAVATALQVGDALLLSSVFDDRIGYVALP
jgi:hypothetical protein